MKAATARFARYKNKLPHCAVVSLTLDVDSELSRVDLACSGSGFVGQGYIEEVPLVGYDDWKEGARAGVRFALSVAGQDRSVVTITKIEGLSTDTNPTIVGAAAALATWSALEFEPSKDVLERIETQACSSWQLPHDAIPEFY